MHVCAVHSVEWTDGIDGEKEDGSGCLEQDLTAYVIEQRSFCTCSFCLRTQQGSHPTTASSILQDSGPSGSYQTQPRCLVVLSYGTQNTNQVFRFWFRLKCW